MAKTGNATSKTTCITILRLATLLWNGGTNPVKPPPSAFPCWRFAACHGLLWELTR
jgi:hypothetical protein